MAHILLMLASMTATSLIEHRLALFPLGNDGVILDLDMEVICSGSFLLTPMHCLKDPV